MTERGLFDDYEVDPDEDNDIVGEVKEIKLKLYDINNPWRGPEYSDFRGFKLNVPFSINDRMEAVYEPKDLNKRDWENEAILIRNAVANDEPYPYLPFFIWNPWTHKWKEVSYGDFFKAQYEFIK